MAIRSPRRERQSEIRFLHRSHDESGFHSAEFLRLPEFRTLDVFGFLLRLRTQQLTNPETNPPPLPSLSKKDNGFLP